MFLITREHSKFIKNFIDSFIYVLHFNVADNKNFSMTVLMKQAESTKTLLNM
jgi:hypothetical protein